MTSATGCKAFVLAAALALGAPTTLAQQAPEPTPAVDDEAADASGGTRDELAAPAEAPSRVAPVDAPDEPSHAARRYTDALLRALLLENRCQAFERDTLGKEPVRSLGSERLARRQRLDRDTAEFPTRLGELPKGPLVPPTRGQGRDLRPLEAVVVNRVSRAYEASRQIPRVKTYEVDLTDFLEKGSWAARDRAVITRDLLLDEEFRWLALVERAEAIVTEGMGDEDLQTMLAELDVLSPDTADSEPSVVTAMLTDEAVRMEIIGQLQGLLSAPVKSQVPEQGDAELLSALPGLQKTLVDKSGLAETFARSLEVEAELVVLEEQLADRGVEAASPDARRELVSRKAELMAERNRVRNTLLFTPPDPEAAQALRDTQDALIRRRMFDLGARAALFGHRYDRLVSTLAYQRLQPGKIWTHLTDQSELISALDGARPAPNPLEGITLDPTSLAPTKPVSKEALAKPIPKPGGGGAPKKKKKPSGGGRP